MKYLLKEFQRERLPEDFQQAQVCREFKSLIEKFVLRCYSNTNSKHGIFLIEQQNKNIVKKSKVQLAAVIANLSRIFLSQRKSLLLIFVVRLNHHKILFIYRTLSLVFFHLIVTLRV